MRRIAILGWGSLYWDSEPRFDRHHRGWYSGKGPSIELEYSQIVPEKDDGLSLVIDPHAGSPCRVGHAFSKRATVQTVIGDLAGREETESENIGHLDLTTGTAHGHDIDTLKSILEWAVRLRIDAVVWTDTPSNFKERIGRPFSVEAALQHILGLDAETKAKVAEYVWRSPSFVDTPLRRALERPPWF
jgi:hypothetical protein